MSMFDLSKTLMYRNSGSPYRHHLACLQNPGGRRLQGFLQEKAFYNSDYPVDLPFHFSKKKKVIGKMEDEATGCPITELVSLRSKMYSYIKDNSCGGKIAKGVKKAVVKKVMKHGKTETSYSTHSNCTTT